MQKFQDIIERVEYVRTQLGMSKSKYASEIQMKPQTYNNFIGTQASKPNVELIYGVVSRYGVNPLWMLTGKGPVFLSDSQENNWGAKNRLEARSAFQWAEEGVQEDSVSFPVTSDSLIKKNLAEIDPLLADLDSQVQQIERYQVPTMDRMVQLLRRYFRIQPILVCEEMKKMLANLQRQLAKNNLSK